MRREAIINEFELHKKWVNTIGKEGKKLNLDEVDLRSLDIRQIG
jgi:hypothetical protein